MELFHKRLGDLYFKYEKIGLHHMKPMEALEFQECLKANALWAKRLSRYEALAQAAEAGGEEAWRRQIDQIIDHHLLNTTGGNS